MQDFRSTLIPAIAVPVSLSGTFFFMQMLGFSINMLTLFALVLAIGIVVDNAIVVVEAVHVKMHNEKLPPLKATKKASVASPAPKARAMTKSRTKPRILDSRVIPLTVASA